MRFINLTEDEYASLHSVLQDILTDHTQETHYKIGPYKHWQKSAWVGEKTGRNLLAISAKLERGRA